MIIKQKSATRSLFCQGQPISPTLTLFYVVGEPSGDEFRFAYGELLVKTNILYKTIWHP